MEQCDGFTDECRELPGFGEIESIKLDECVESVFLRIMLICLCKWIVALAQTGSANHVELASCHGYRVNPTAHCEDLISCAFVFSPVIATPTDTLGAERIAGISECDAAKQIARRVKSLLDLDAVLDSRPEIVEELIAETETLLRAARYDVSGYAGWASD